MRMKLVDRHGRVRERALTIITLRGRDAPGAPPSAPDGDRLLIRFTYPNDIRGTSFLVWEHPDSDDERFLYLPSLGRVRRIAGTEAQESFVGSDFTYEDIGGREFDDYTYAFAAPDGENASWSPAAGGPPRPAWRLESRRKDKAAEFPRVVSLVLKDALIVAGADVYNRRNEKQKVYTVRRLEQIESIWTVMESEMTNAIEKTRTELIVESMDYNVGLKETDFSRRGQSPSTGRAGRQVSQALAGWIYRWRIPLSVFIVVGALVQAPLADITKIDNDITAWFSKDDPVYKDYERYRTEFGGTRALIIALKADSADRLFSRGTLETIEAITGDIERVDTVHQVQQPRDRHHRRGAEERER